MNKQQKENSMTHWLSQWFDGHISLSREQYRAILCLTETGTSIGPTPRKTRKTLRVGRGLRTIFPKKKKNTYHRQPTVWTSGRLAELKKDYLEGKSFLEMSKKHGCSIQAGKAQICLMRKREGLSRRYATAKETQDTPRLLNRRHKHWTTQEDDALKTMVQQGRSFREIGRGLGRKTVATKLRYKILIERNGPRQVEVWTPTEDSQLIDMAKEGRNMEYIAINMRRPLSAVVARLGQLRRKDPYVTVAQRVVS